MSANSLVRGFSRGAGRDTRLERGCSVTESFLASSGRGQGTPSGTHHQGHGILPWAAYPSTQDVHTLGELHHPWPKQHHCEPSLDLCSELFSRFLPSLGFLPASELMLLPTLLFLLFLNPFTPRCS